METNALNFQKITKGLATKSAKIRALGQAGVATGEIARFLGIRYQHARNVLVDAGLRIGRPREAAISSARVNPLAGAAKSRGAWLKIAADGGVAVPLQFLAAAGLKPGGQVHVRINGDAIELFSQKEALRRAHEIAKQYIPPGVSLVDELIAERRAEARRELEGS